MDSVLYNVNINFIIINGLSIINVVFFLNYYLKPKYKYSNVILAMVVVLLTIIARIILTQILIKSMITVVSLIIALIYLYRGSFIKKLFAPIILLASASISELISLFILQITMIEIYENNYLTIGLLSNVIMAIIECLIIKLDNKNKSSELNSFNNIFIISLIPFVFAITIFRLASQFPFWQGKFLYLVLIVIIWLVIDLLLYKQVKYLQNSIKEEIVNKSINDYYYQTLLKYIEIKEDNEDYRKIRHDLINYIESIKDKE